MIDTFDAIFYTLAFIMPGFLLDLFSRFFLPQKELSDNRNVLYYLFLSCINYAPWMSIIYGMHKGDFYNQSPILFGIAWFGFIVISPLLFAFLRAILYKFDIRKKISSFFKMNTIHPIPTAWDYKFLSMNTGRWICVKLTDDSEVYGVFGGTSLASSDANERDIYIEQVYDVSDSGEWTIADRTDGMLIKAEYIKAISFWNDNERKERSDGE